MRRSTVQKILLYLLAILLGFLVVWQISEFDLTNIPNTGDDFVEQVDTLIQQVE